MAADALATCVARPSAAIVWSVSLRFPSIVVCCSEKKGKQRDPFQYIQHQQAAQGAADGNQVPMYRKREVYAGVSEFSFEELRAVKYFKEIKEKAGTNEMYEALAVVTYEYIRSAHICNKH